VPHLRGRFVPAKVGDHEGKHPAVIRGGGVENPASQLSVSSLYLLRAFPVIRRL